MDFFTKLNLDRLYAHKKPWHPSPWFLNIEKVIQINELIQDIHNRLTRPPSVAHQSLYTRFSSDYFWQSITIDSEYDAAYNIWKNTKTLIYANDGTLIWLVDYALPLLEEYLECGMHECQLLTKKANAYPWLVYLPGLDDYLESIGQLDHFLQQYTAFIHALKQEWHHTIKLKIEQQTDLLKLIAQKLGVSCDFVSEETLHANTLALFKQHYHAETKLKLPHYIMDKAPPLISPTDAFSAWSKLTNHLKTLKENHRFTVSKAKIPTSTWFDHFPHINWLSIHQAKIYLLKKGVQYAGPPILIGLLLHGWLSLTTFGLSAGAWFIYPHLHSVLGFLDKQWQKWDLVFESSSDAFLRDFLVERTEYIEMIERSALWRKNTLASGCHHINSFDPSLIRTTYESFQSIFEQHIQALTKTRPYFWQFWRRDTTTLINTLISELEKEKEALLVDIKAYATDVAKRLNQSLFSQNPYFLDKIIAFISYFAPNGLSYLDQENRAIEYFLACTCQHNNAPVLFNRALTNPSLFSTHCIDIVSLDDVIHQICLHIKNPNKLQAISALAALLKQETLMSIEQLDNYLAIIETQKYKFSHIKQAIQQHLFSTFNGENSAIKKFFTPGQHKKLTEYLQNNQTAIQEAQHYFQFFLDLPTHQDWGTLPDNIEILSPETLNEKVILLKLSDNHIFISQLQNKIMALAPYYSGAPTSINLWLNVLWQEKCPIELEEIVIENRFTWILDNDQPNEKSDTDKMQTFIQEMSHVFPKADNNHRLSRALVCQPQFYLPWQAHTQKMLDELEHKGLLLTSAKAGYSQKALRAWLQSK